MPDDTRRMIFLSHERGHGFEADLLRRCLEAELDGVRVFEHSQEHQGARPSTRDHLREAIQRSAAMVLLISDGSSGSFSQGFEVCLAEVVGCPVFPLIQRGGSKLTAFLGDREWTEAKDWRRILAPLRQELRAGDGGARHRGAAAASTPGSLPGVPSAGITWLPEPSAEVAERSRLAGTTLVETGVATRWEAAESAVQVEVILVASDGCARPLALCTQQGPEAVRRSIREQVERCGTVTVIPATQALASPLVPYVLGAAEAFDRPVLVYDHHSGRYVNSSPRKLARSPAHARGLHAWSGRLPNVGDRYELLRHAGSGGGGEVYEACERLTGRRVAVKVLHAGRASWELGRREWVALRGLRLPGVVQLLHQGEVNGVAYLVTEWTDGLPFPGTLERTWEAIRKPTLSMLQTLQIVHARGVVHGDLKPQNVLVSRDHVAHILDFGLARGQGALPGSAEAFTPGFAAPEQLERRPYDHRSDIYAIGATLHDALLGRPPDEGVGDACIVGLLGAGVPKGVAGCIGQMLRAEPEERPRSVSEIREALGASYDQAVQAMVRQVLDDAAGEVTCDTLRQLFTGPDRVLRLRADAARALWNRTGTDPRLLVSELSGWLDAGIAQWGDDTGRVRVERAELERLRSGWRYSGPAFAGQGVPCATEDELELARWVDLAGFQAQTEVLAGAMGTPAPELVLRLHEMAQRGQLVELPEGRWRRAQADPIAPPWPPEERRAAHLALARALPAHDPGRVIHRARATPLTAEDLLALTHDTLTVARTLQVAGRLSEAGAVLRLSLQDVRSASHDGTSPEQCLLVQLAKAAVAEASDEAFNLALLEFGRRRSHPSSGGDPQRQPNDTISRLERMLQAAVAARRGAGPVVVDLVDGIDPFEEDPELERCRYGVLAMASNADSKRTLEVLRRCAEWARGSNNADTRALGLSWQGLSAYERGDYAGAASLHAESERMATEPRNKMVSRLNEVVAALEWDVDHAASRACEAISTARACGFTLLEARAEALCRAARYRRGDALEVDEDLVEALISFGDPESVGIACLTEAALAWRLGHREQAQELAWESIEGYRLQRNTVGEVLAESLAVAAGHRTTPGRVLELAAKAYNCGVPSVGVQALGLLAGAGVLEGWDALLARIADRAAGDHAGHRYVPSQRLDICSIHESLGLDPLGTEPTGEAT